MVGLLDDLDGATDAEIQRLLGSVRGERGPRVQVSARTNVKLGTRPKKGIKAPWEPRFENINEIVKVEIELPLYMAVAMGGLSYREAVRKHLQENGRGAWAESRFLRGSEAAMMRAKDLFTRTFKA